MNQCVIAAMVLTIAFHMNVLNSERDQFLSNVTAHSQLAEVCTIGDGSSIEGLEGKDDRQHVCCPLACEKCGGEGCSTKQAGADACCVSNVAKKKGMCSETKKAPCVLKKAQPERVCTIGDGSSIEGLEGKDNRQHVCCPLACEKCGGKECSTKQAGADACCVSNVAKKKGMCSETKEAPCVLKKVQPESVCTIGDGSSIEGLEGKDDRQQVCCPLECEKCGGEECSTKQAGADACCVSNVAEKQGMCSETKEAPCVLKKPQPEPQQCSDQWKGFIGESVNADKVCCPEECGQCGGQGCGESGREAKCCVSNVLDGGRGKKCSKTQGPPCVLKFSSADGLLAGPASWALPVLLAIASTQYF